MADRKITEMNILWLDIETTGLDPTMDIILEVAAQYYVCGQLYGEVNSPVKDRSWIGIHRLMDDYVYDMHAKTGLLHRLERNEGKKLSAIEEDLLDLIGDDKPRLGGCSVHTDRAYFINDMPKLHKALSHQHVDASGIHRFLLDAGVAVDAPANDNKHNAMADTIFARQLYDACLKSVMK